MALGSKLKGLFKRSRAEEMADPEARARFIESACAEAKQLRERQPKNPDAWRQPLIQALDVLSTAGIGETELLRAAAQALPDDEHWRKELVTRLLPAAHIPKEDLPTVEQEAIAQRRNLRLWKRLFEEARYYEDDKLRIRFGESYVLAVWEFFPARGDSSWFDMESEQEARSRYLNLLDEVADRVIASGRRDKDAWEILRAAREHFPERSETVMALLPIVVERGFSDGESLEVLLQGLLIDPDNLAAKRHAGRLLALRKGHAEQGVEMLLQCHQEEPGDTETVEAIVEHLKREGVLRDGCIPVLEEWFEKRPGDTEAAKLLANYYAAQEDTSPTALAAYRAAGIDASEDLRMLRLVGESYAAAEDWERVAEIFEKLHATDPDSREFSLPLASAYANLGRTDSEARRFYEDAIHGGSRNPAIHDRFCEILYRDDPYKPAARNQFRQSLQIDREGYWAGLGTLWLEAHATDSMDAVIEHALPLLRKHPDGEELKEFVAEAVAAHPRRQTIRPILGLPAAIALDIFEKAREQNREALLILTNIARYRIMLKKLDDETRELVERVLQRDPEQEDLQLKFANLLWEEGEQKRAMEMDLNLLRRWKQTSTAATNTSSSAISRTAIRERDTILVRVAEWLAAQDEIDSEDQMLLMEGALSPDADQDFVLQVASAIANSNGGAQLRLALLERASAISPEDGDLALALAETRVQRGAPRRALQDILHHVERGKNDARAEKALRIALERLKPGEVTSDIAEMLATIYERRRSVLSPAMLGLLATVAARAATLPPRIKPLLDVGEKAAPEPQEVHRALERLHRLGT